jgi:hypothetical protein
MNLDHGFIHGADPGTPHTRGDEPAAP